jgi:hypothetical protein
MKIIDYLGTKPKSFIWIIALLLNLIMGVLDYLTGYDIKMEVFYIMPIGIISWFISRSAGLSMAVISATTTMYANIFAGQVIVNLPIYFWNILVNFGFFLVVVYLVSEGKMISDNNQLLLGKLQRAVDEIKTLSSLLPICSSCKGIRDDDGSWKQMEIYIREHTGADFTHRICPECRQKLYSDLAKKRMSKFTAD